MVNKNIHTLLVLATLILPSFFAAQAAQVTLELEDATATVGLNQPFSLNIIIKDGGNPGNIAIQGLDQVQVLQQGQSSSTQIINGSSSSTITYHVTVQARREGPLTLGPAQITVDGKPIVSNTVSVQVNKNHTPSAGQQNGKQTGQPSVFCKLSADKQNVVVGEPVTLTLSVYRHGQILEMGLENVNFDRFLVKELKDRTERNEVVDGISYHVQEIKYVLTPLQEGVRELKPISVQYVVQQQQKRAARHGHFDFGGAFEAFFGQQPERKMTTSNDIKITVSPLPEHKGQVHGVGDFKAFSASINKLQADVSEPLTLTLSIEGKGNFEQIAIPALTIPKWFKSYESKTETLDSNGGSKKNFDFVVQATKPGNVTIPPQTFTYFDVTTRSYKTLKTAPINLEINVPEDYQQTPVQASRLPDSLHNTALPLPNSDGQVHTAMPGSSLIASGGPALPWWLFLLLLLAPLVMFKKKLVSFASQVITKLFGKRMHRHNLALFEKKFDAIQASGDASTLHRFFIKFLAEKNSTTIDVVTEDWIEQLLRQSGWNPEKIDEFLEFLSTCARLQFMQSQAGSIDQNALLKKSKYWLIMLNK